MTGNRLLENMLRFVMPIIIAGLCQRLFHIADTAVVGRMIGAGALAAVGGSGSIVQLFAWGLEGFAVGADVVVSNRLGSGDDYAAERAVHTSYALALTVGAAVAAAGIALSRLFLTAMHIPADIEADAVLYLRIWFVGLFFNIIYNFGAACMRADGDTQRPTLYMMLAGLMNVVLDILFVGTAQMGVAGAAIATVLSQAAAAVPVTVSLMRSRTVVRLDPAQIRIDRRIAGNIVRIGLPACIQNSLFSISNIAVHTCLNSFGSMAVAANSAAFTIEGFGYAGIDAVTQTCTTFTGQNTGAGKPANIRRVLWLSIALTTISGLAAGIAALVFYRPLIGIFTTEPAIIALSIHRIRWVTFPLFLNGIMDVLAASMRGMGSSMKPTVISLIGICVFRLAYIFTVFRAIGTLECLYICYPASWIITIAALWCCRELRSGIR